MRELPIIYSAPMILAKKAGRKTMTRRTVGLEVINAEPDNWKFIRTEVGNSAYGPTKTFALFTHNNGIGAWIPCPYGQPSDVLYARENLHQQIDGSIRYNADYSLWLNSNGYHYRHEEYEGIIPSIHMPKIASRIWDRVEGIRVERLHFISVEDIIREGWGMHYNEGDTVMVYDALKGWEDLWIKINGVESWVSNPYVWVISTKNLSTTCKPASLCTE